MGSEKVATKAEGSGCDVDGGSEEGGSRAPRLMSIDVGETASPFF